MTAKPLSTVFSVMANEISSEEYAILPPNDMAKRETMGQRLKRARLEQGLSVPQLREKILEEYRAEVGASTIRNIEDDFSPNPGFKTLELVAKGNGLDPLQVFALGLDEPPELDPGYSESQIAQIARTYKQVRKDKKAFADELIKMLIEKFDEWR